MKLTPSRHYPGGRFDYRLALEDLIDCTTFDAQKAGKRLTRAMIAGEAGFTGPGLSNVLAKRRHLSIEQLEKILEVTGHRLTFEVDPIQSHQTRPLD